MRMITVRCFVAVDPQGMQFVDDDLWGNCRESLVLKQIDKRRLIRFWHARSL
jgi:hypothetical protein